MWGPTGWTRLFNADFGGQISWLLPAALVLLAAGLVLTWRAPRTDRTRAALVLWGGWLRRDRRACSASARGSSTPTTRSRWRRRSARSSASARRYLWRARHHVAARGRARRRPGRHRGRGRTCCSAARPTGTRGCAPSSWSPGWSLRRAGLLVPVAGSAAAPASSLAVGAIVVALAGPAAYAFATAATAHSGAIPSAGPAVAPARLRARWRRSGGFARRLRAAAAGDGRHRTARRRSPAAAAASRRRAAAGPGWRRQRRRPARTAARRRAELVDLLEARRGSTRGWPPRSAPTRRPATSSPPASRSWRSAASTAPTRRRHSAQFQAYVADGKIHYFIGGGASAVAAAASAGRRLVHSRADQRLGREPLHLQDGRRRDAVRPQPSPLTPASTPGRYATVTVARRPGVDQGMWPRR